MSKKDPENKEEAEKERPTPDEPGGEQPVPGKRPFFTFRKVLISAVALAIVVLLIFVIAAILFRAGVFDTYTKNQFRAKLADIGIAFDADVFRVSASPLELELKNATFNDKTTGDKLFFIRDARLGMTIVDLLSLRLSRDISIDTTDINGAEVWVKFDENGRSNFSNLKLVEDQTGSAVNFRYDSVIFKVEDSIVHFGDVSRKISADARNLSFLLSPERADLTDTHKRYKFDLTATDSKFAYDAKVVEKIDIRASGIADNTGADISSLRLQTPIGDATLSGRLTDWAAPKYNFDIQSSLDLTQTSGIFANDTTLSGVGNFKGKVTGEGENYRIKGEADSESLRVGGLYLKAVNVAATVAGTNANYDADGS